MSEMTEHQNEAKHLAHSNRWKGLATGLFRDTESPQPDIEPERVYWLVRLKRVAVGVYAQGKMRHRDP